MFVVSSCIFNLVVLGMLVSFYSFTVLILFMCQSSLYWLQELNKTYLLTYELTAMERGVMRMITINIAGIEICVT